MTTLDIRKVGDGLLTVQLLLGSRIVTFKGLTDCPRVGDQFEIDGELWRVVDARRSYIGRLSAIRKLASVDFKCTRSAPQTGQFGLCRGRRAKRFVRSYDFTAQGHMKSFTESMPGTHL